VGTTVGSEAGVVGAGLAISVGWAAAAVGAPSVGGAAVAMGATPGVVSPSGNGGGSEVARAAVVGSTAGKVGAAAVSSCVAGVVELGGGCVCCPAATGAGVAPPVDSDGGDASRPGDEPQPTKAVANKISTEKDASQTEGRRPTMYAKGDQLLHNAAAAKADGRLALGASKSDRVLRPPTNLTVKV